MQQQTNASQLTMLNPAGLYDPTPNGYSHVVLTPGQSSWVFVSGQGGEDANGVLAAEFELQLRQSLANLVTALTAAEAGLQDVARLTILVVGHNEQRLRLISQTINEAWAGRPTPACTLIPVPRLALDGMLIEIDAVASLAAREVMPA
ncbi:RidA family protein [Halopseudomonas pelagia]|uniref:RidA family protein n=1 Tax=Halopseudomonas pelagia TaxID=553151 RepID=UPI00039B69C1|nr:RidA family protein [Halopseudomonas pelagia]